MRVAFRHLNFKICNFFSLSLFFSLSQLYYWKVGSVLDTTYVFILVGVGGDLQILNGPEKHFHI